MPFSFVEDGAVATIRYDNDAILTFQEGYMRFGGQYSVQNQWFEPGGDAKVAFFPVFAVHGYNNAVTNVRYECETDGHELTLRIIPTETLAGGGVFELVRDICTINVRLDDGRFVWTQTMSVTFLKDVDASTLTNKTPVRLYRFPGPDGESGMYLQFHDPMPVGASGPAVPMTRDWRYIPEPTVGDDVTFRHDWRRQCVSIIFPNDDGSYSWTELNKRKFHHLVETNLRARTCHPRGTLYLVLDDGRALAYECDAPSHYHHVCEWGMDFHFWMDAKPFLKDGFFRAGTTIEASTTARLAGADLVQGILDQASYIDLTEEERFFADVPAYEEPENTFTVSALDRLDAQYWTPTSEGCSWRKTGGYRKGTGCLVIRNHVSPVGEWRQEFFGPSHFANPFIPGARYRLSAWVRLEDLRPVIFPEAAVGVEFHHYHGPAKVSKREMVPGGWSAPVWDFTKPVMENIGWTYIELITEPCPSYTLWSHLIVRFRGRGTAHFSNIRWELYDGSKTLSTE